MLYNISLILIYFLKTIIQRVRQKKIKNTTPNKKNTRQYSPHYLIHQNLPIIHHLLSRAFQATSFAIVATHVQSLSNWRLSPYIKNPNPTNHMHSNKSPGPETKWGAWPKWQTAQYRVRLLKCCTGLGRRMLWPIKCGSPFRIDDTNASSAASWN